MDYTLIDKKYYHCCRLITEKRLREAFVVLQELADESHNSDLLAQLENHRETYRNILKYSFGEVEDPRKTEVYYRLLRSVIELADLVYESLLTSRLLVSYYSLKQEIERKPPLTAADSTRMIETLAWEHELAGMYNPDNENEVIDAGLKQKEREKNLHHLFNLLWLTDKYREAEKELVLQMIASKTLPWYDKALMISALILSLQRCFDETKIELLVSAYLAGENQVWQRALVGLIITLYQHHQRLYLYPEIQNLLGQLKETPGIDKQIEAIVIQFIKSKDTEKITRKFQDEILPEMAKLQSRIYDKLDLQNIVKDPLSEEKNPDWEHVFEDTPNLYNKLEEFSMLQMEGSDVFMSTFAMLKNFDFFREFSNWFLPFYKENPGVQQALHDEKGQTDTLGFAEAMEKSVIMCNSDKYSFCLNVQRLPEMQRGMMLEMFNMELKSMDEVAQEDELLLKPSADRVIFTQYIQDLYRFCKLHPQKHEFYDVFATPFDLHKTECFRFLITDPAIYRNIGEFYFEKEHYPEAIGIFIMLDTELENYELWQKIAYSYQKLGAYDKALAYYLKADLADTRKAWNIKKIALCYRKLGNYRKALEYYKAAEKLEPDNLQLQASLGHVCFDLKEYEEALRYYFKVEFLAPDNHKIQRPIAWCSLMLGKPETAEKYFEKIISTEGNQHDLLNMGHVEWCMRNKMRAIEYYQKSIRKASYNFNWFSEEFTADSEILIQYGIDPVDIPLMRDYLRISIENEL